MTAPMSAMPTLPSRHRLGHVQEFRTARLGLLKRVVKECGPVARGSFFGRDLLFVNGPESIHEVLVEKAKSFEKSWMLRTVLFPLAGDGLFTSEGALWKRQRRLMAPMFHHGQVASFAALMTEGARRAAEHLADGATVDVARLTTQVAMTIVGRALFDAETFDEADELGAALTTALKWADEKSGALSSVLQLHARGLVERARPHLPAALQRASDEVIHFLRLPVTYRTPGGREMRHAVSVIDSRVQRMIDERRAARVPHDDLLTRLLKARDEDDGAGMGDKQVRDEAVTLFVAGHETTATGLAWAFYHLAQDPAMYARVRAEGDALGGRAPTMEDLPKLAYSMQVFKEALRMYPPVYVYPRQAAVDVEIAGYKVPMGTPVMVNLYGMQHDPAIYPDPERFDPERFTPAAEAARPRGAWLPFSSGPRVCIGNHFAMMEGQIVLATLAHCLTFALASDRAIDAEPYATLRPRGGVPMVVHRRAHTAEGLSTVASAPPQAET